MKCESCGMEVKDPPVIEIVRGKEHHYCCEGCRDYGWCLRDGSSKKLWRKMKRRIYS